MSARGRAAHARHFFLCPLPASLTGCGGGCPALHGASPCSSAHARHCLGGIGRQCFRELSVQGPCLPGPWAGSGLAPLLGHPAVWAVGEQGPGSLGPDASCATWPGAWVPVCRPCSWLWLRWGAGGQQGERSACRWHACPVPRFCPRCFSCALPPSLVGSGHFLVGVWPTGPSLCLRAVHWPPCVGPRRLVPLPRGSLQAPGCQPTTRSSSCGPRGVAPLVAVPGSWEGC